MNAEQGKQPPSQQEPGPALFFCHLCQSAYRQPKLLKCLHSFCMLCLRDTVIRDDNDLHLIICPLCTIATTLPPGGGGVEQLVDNPFLQRVSSEYVTEVKSHIVAKSLRPQVAKKLGPYEAYIQASGARRRFSEEMAQLKTANLTDEQKTVSSRNLMYNKGNSPAVEAGAAATPAPRSPVVGFSEFRRTSVDRGEYTLTATEAVNNMSRLQGKLMSLQGEALRVTYVIDRINQDMTNWHQHKEDLKQEVQRRSHQFQIAAKKMERQILSQIESKAVEDQFYAELDRGKSELRRNLKNILHEVSVLKCVNELGKYSEINDLSSSLLGPSAGISEVTLDMLSYQFDVPNKPIDEMMAVGFGNLISSQEQRQIYVPEYKDFVNAPLDQMTSSIQSSLQLETQTIAEGGEEATTSARSRGRTTASRRSQSTAGRSKRYTSDLGLGRIEVQEHLEEFQNARETFRNKRQEILRKGQHAREDHSPIRGEGRKLSWPNFRRGRVQSLDRSSNANDKMNMGMKSSHTARDEASASYAAEGTDNSDHTEDEQGGRPTEQGIPSPIIEEGVIPHSPKKEVKTDDRVPTRCLPQTPPACGGRGFSELLAEGRQRRISLESSSRQSSIDESPPQSPSADSGVKGDFQPNANDRGRHLRKALSGATDRRSKMELLRENWQKRKEILIQSHGFLSSEGATSPGKTKIDSLVSSNSGSALSQRRFSDVEREDTDTVSPSNTSSVASALPLATARYQGPGLLASARATPTATAKSPMVTTVTAQQQLPLHDVQRKDTSYDDNDDDEQEVTSTVTIPITELHLNVVQEDTKESITAQQVEDEQEEETVVTTETFLIGNTLMTDGATAVDFSHHPSGCNPPSTSATRAEQTLSVNSQAIMPRSVTSHSTTLPGTLTSATTATATALAASSASAMHTSITTGTTLTAPSSIMPLRNNTIQSSSSSTSSTSSASTTTRSRLQSPSRLSTRIDSTRTTTATTASNSPSTLTTSLPATTTTTAASSKTTGSTTATSSTATPSTSYLARFTKRQATPMETIDVAALIANMYKPSSSSSTSSSSSSSQKVDDKKTDDEEKENVRNEKEKGSADTAPKDQSTPNTIIGTDRQGSRYTFAYKSSLNTDRTAILGKTPTVDSAHTKTTDVTVFKITEDAKASQSPESTAVSPSSQLTLPYRLSRKEPTAVIKENNANRATPTPVTAADVLEPVQHGLGSHVLPSSPRDLKVDETFSQAESSRKRYSPGSSRSSARSNRRHTVEISKTIPEGMRLSDMYNPASKEADPIPESRVHSQPQSDLHRTVIEEAQDELAKDSGTSRSETLTSWQMVGSSIVESTSSSSSLASHGKAQQADPGSTLSGIRIPSSGVLSALHVRQTESATVSPSSPTAATSMMLPYSTLISDPDAGQASAGTAARGKLRDIARKKKERWRRLTIS